MTTKLFLFVALFFSSCLSVIARSLNMRAVDLWNYYAQGYDFFTANPLSEEICSKGENELNFKLLKDESTTFKHRIIVSNKELSSKDLNSKFINFSSK